MRISTESVSTLKQSKIYFPDDVWKLLQDSLLGTVDGITPGDEYPIPENDFSETSEKLKKRGIAPIENPKALHAKSLFRLAIAASHDYDPGKNTEFMSKMSGLMSNWINS